MINRTSHITRNTTETNIDLHINVDGQCKSSLETGVPFFDHMLTLFSKHGLFDLTLKVKGDLEVDAHHSVEDTGICLGQAFHEAIGDGRGIRRYASVIVPMDEALCQLAIDVSNRPYFGFNVPLEKGKVGNFDVELMEEFFNAFVNNARINLHMTLLAGRSQHHIMESGFKAFGVCLDQATQIDPRKTDIPSTKGSL